MIKKRFISMLVLLAAVATGAWADQLASSYSSNATLNEVTVSASMEVTIATGVTVTINNGLNITSGTLTVKGPGTLVVNGKAGSNGGYSALSNGGNGTPGSAAITGNIIVQGGATVKATGGNGGNGGNSGSETGGNGAQGGAAITGEVTIQDASTLEATGGNGGNGGNGDDGGNGGNGGVAFAGTLTYKGGTVTADGGNGGSGGWGDMDEGYGPSGSAGNAFTTSVNFVSSDYILTDGSNAITATQVTSKKKVVISPKVAVNSVTLAPTSATLTLGETETVTLIPTVLPGDATDKTVTWTTSNASVATVTDGVVTAVAAGTATITVTTTDGAKTATCTVTVAEPTYTVTVKEGTEDATSWTIAPAEATTTGVEAGTEVKATYSGTKKVKSVKAKKKAAAAPALNLTSPAVGQVIGDDGKNYDYASLPGGVTAVAKICYVSGSNGLALALADEGQMNWSTAISTCAAHTPAFTGGTWKLATQDEWNNMISGAGSYTALRNGFTSVGGSNLQESGLYWSSTERNASHARYYSFYAGSWSIDNKDNGNIRVRACLEF